MQPIKSTMFEVITHWPREKMWIFNIVEGIAKIRGMPVEELIPEFVEKELESYDGSGQLGHYLDQRMERETKGKRS